MLDNLINNKIFLEKEFSGCLLLEFDPAMQRVYAKPEYEIGILAQDAKVEFYDIEIMK
ncbi:hypothetical protein C806_00608 [Lachnospiraceae bacterium 3-1]|nr:hypothetical protein C806_00608 [Lachnospiraceae bacterium 3-1]